MCIYMFRFCSCKAAYYGKTGMNNKGNRIRSVSSSFMDDIKDTGNSASIEDFCIIDNVGNELDVLILESLLVLRD